MNWRINRLVILYMLSNLCKEFVRFHLSFTWVIKMHRIYICAQFTCLIHTAKMALFTGLEHSANRNILAIAPGRIKGGWIQTCHKFSNSRNFEMIYYKCIPLYSFVCFEPSFKAIKSFKLAIFPDGHYFFCHIFLNIGAKTNSWR